MENENEPANNEASSNEPNGGGTPAPQANGPEGDLKDKHGEDAINRGRYEREMRAKDDQIAQLTKQLEEANGKAESGAKALEAVKRLEAQLADEKVSGALKVAGCVNEKAAKAVLADYDNDVEKLAKECPYLFGGNAETRQAGSTGARHHGAPGKDDEDAELDKLFGLK